jgi:uncharacterized membrane protein
MEIDGDLPPSNPGAPAATASFDAVHAPRWVVGDRGASWVVEGWDMFRQSLGGWLPLALAGVIWLLLIDRFSILLLLDSLFAYVIAAGLLLACQANHRRQPVTLNHLLAGFRLHLGRLLIARLVVLGLSLLIFCLVLGDVVWQIAQQPDLQVLLKKISAQTDYTSEEMLSNLAEVDQAFGLMSLMLRAAILLLLVIPVSAAGWFAPALIVLGNCNVKTALWYSLQATLKNLLSFLIYGLLLLILALLGILPYRVGYLVLIPVYYLSMYLCYRDIFVN